MLVLIVCASLVARVFTVVLGAEDDEHATFLDAAEDLRVDVSVGRHVDDLAAAATRGQRVAQLHRHSQDAVLSAETE